MKKLLITLLLISPFSFADWGDVYYCQETTSTGVTLKGKPENYSLEKFQFKLDKTKNAMVFGKGGYFHNLIMKLRENEGLPSIELWYADTQYSITYFDKGKLLHVMTGTSGITSISADCDKF
jgi:hypothetical protein